MLNCNSFSHKKQLNEELDYWILLFTKVIGLSAFLLPQAFKNVKAPEVFIVNNWTELLSLSVEGLVHFYKAAHSFLQIQSAVLREAALLFALFFTSVKKIQAITPQTRLGNTDQTEN